MLCTAGIVLRDPNGEWLYGRFIKIKASSPAEAEFVALREGLFVAIFKDLTRFQIETDAKAVKVMIDNAQEYFTHHLGALIMEVSRMINGFQNMEILHVRGEGNVVAYTLAKEGQRSTSDVQNFDVPPGWIKQFLDHDITAIRAMQ